MIRMESERLNEIALKKPPQPASPGDKTLTKGLQLLEALSECEGSRGISDLAHELSLTKSNVHRLLQTLSRCGYVTREASTERYLLSSKLWQVSRRGRSFDALRSLARPILRNLVEETNESALFVVVEHEDLVVIDQVQTPNPVRVVFFSMGQSFPIDRVVMLGKGLTALQLIALSSRPEAEARSALRKVQEQLKRGKSFIDDQLSELLIIRKNGCAVNRGAWVSGVNAVAVPVSDLSNNLIGILSCFGPADRLTSRSLGSIQKALARKARELSQRLSA
jgi:IclR family transcriptional regulator, KDG regulon repressor